MVTTVHIDKDLFIRQSGLCVSGTPYCGLLFGIAGTHSSSGSHAIPQLSSDAGEGDRHVTIKRFIPIFSTEEYDIWISTILRHVLHENGESTSASVGSIDMANGGGCSVDGAGDDDDDDDVDEDMAEQREEAAADIANNTYNTAADDDDDDDKGSEVRHTLVEKGLQWIGFFCTLPPHLLQTDCSRLDCKSFVHDFFRFLHCKIVAEALRSKDYDGHMRSIMIKLMQDLVAFSIGTSVITEESGKQSVDLLKSRSEVECVNVSEAYVTALSEYAIIDPAEGDLTDRITMLDRIMENANDRFCTVPDDHLHNNHLHTVDETIHNESVEISRIHTVHGGQRTVLNGNGRKRKKLNGDHSITISSKKRKSGSAVSSNEKHGSLTDLTHTRAIEQLSLESREDVHLVVHHGQMSELIVAQTQDWRNASKTTAYDHDGYDMSESSRFIVLAFDSGDFIDRTEECVHDQFSDLRRLQGEYEQLLDSRANQTHILRQMDIVERIIAEQSRQQNQDSRNIDSELQGNKRIDLNASFSEGEEEGEGTENHSHKEEPTASTSSRPQSKPIIIEID